MTEANRNLAIRLLTSAVIAPGVIYLVYRGGWLMALLFSVAAVISVLEFYEITMKGWSPAAWVGIGVTGLFPMLPMTGDSWGVAAFYVVVAFGMFAWTYHLIRGPLKEGPQNVSHLVAGMVYSAAGPTSLVCLRLLGGDENGGHWVMVVMYLSFLNDTFAYFTGRAIGKHKLYPEVSPNKTWEGFFGGMAGATAGLFVFRWLGFHSLSVVDVLILSLAGGIMGPIGDFSESMLKRAYGVKDSGKIIPGHGGILDRIDALIFNATIVFLYANYLRPLIGG
ncbi:MAG TPA: phosphatidate cytidylyltransferase [Myxococcaceae bacterium]|nr:phosphatidate cytidylyltransferase [Myxococcaceae bacterium]